MLTALNLVEVGLLCVIAGALVYAGIQIHAIFQLVELDADAAVQYRLDVLKLQAGMFRRAGRQAVFARRNGKQDERDEYGGDDLSHDLMVRVGADA